MDVKPGYKHSEIGIVPEDWEVEPIEGFAHITTGGKNTQDRVDDGRYPFYVRSQTVERINSYSFDGEAVLTAGDGVGTGKIFHFVCGKFDAHQRVYRISDFNERINGYYFYLQFSSRFYYRIMAMTAKSSVDSVRREMIADMLIPLPPTKAEQEAIAEALSDTDALIESLEQLLVKKRQIKQGAMQELLTGRRRLPGFEVRPGYKQTEVGVIPEDWDVASLRDIVGFINGRPHEGDVRVDGRYSLITLDSIDIAGNLKSEHKQTDVWDSSLRKGDIVAVLSDLAHGNLLGLCDVIPEDDNYVLNQRMGRLRLKVAADPLFTRLQINCRQKHFKSRGQGTSQRHVYKRDFNSLSIPFPSFAEQRAISEVLSVTSATIDTLEAKLTKARQIKQGMMQELLTGRIRLV
jgi:type I restriction enzyme, S subunit